MNWNIRRLLMGWVIAGFCLFSFLMTPIVAFAQDGVRWGVFDRVHEQFTPELNSVETSGGNNVRGCSGPTFGAECRSSGVYFSTEFTLIDISQPAGSSLAPNFLRTVAPNAAIIGNLNPDTDPSARFQLGYQNSDGLGGQVTYWGFDNTASLALSPTGANDPNLIWQSWNVGTLDVEASKRTLFGSLWDTQITGGYRLARYEENVRLRRDLTEVGNLQSRYIGNGFTGSAGVRRQIGSHFSLMTNLRTSLLLGTQDVNASPSLPSNPVNGNFDTRFVLESQFGGSYEYPIRGGGFWFVRGGYELQHWNDFIIPVGNQVNSESTLLHGAFLSAGLQR